MRDAEIREALLGVLRRRHGADPGTLIRQEMGLCASERRVDIAVINGEINGYEIKSDVDTLTRLEGQAETYGRVLDKAVLVAARRHITHALDILPVWWGVVVAEPFGEYVALRHLRTAKPNPTVDPISVAQLLWRSEALEALRVRGMHRGLANKRRWLIWERMAERIPLPELQDLVRDQIRARQAWPGGQ